MPIEKLGIVGSGTSGVDLAEVAALAAIEVVAVHVEGDDPLALWEGVTQALAHHVARGTLSDAGREVALSRIQLACEPELLAQCDLVFECATQLPLERRRGLLLDIEQHLDARAIIAAKASGPAVDTLSHGLMRPCRFVGLDPLHRDATRFIEVTPTDRTRPAVIEAVEALIARLGRAPLRISEPSGFGRIESGERASVF